MNRDLKYKRYFTEMSFSRKQIEHEILSSNRNRCSHFLLLFLYPKDINRNHWISEICADFLDISSMKWRNNNKFLNEKDYIVNLWTKPFENNDDYEMIDKIFYDLENDYPVYKKVYFSKKAKFVEKLHSLYVDISKMLYKGTLTRIELKSLIAKYF